MVTTGVLCLFYSSTLGARGGFYKSIAADFSAAAPPVAPILANEGEGASAYLGLEAMDIGSTIASQLDLSSKSGVLVTAVMPGSPAETAGLKRGDVIIALNNRSVSNLDGFRALVSDVQPSDAVRLLFISGGTKRLAYVVAGTVPAITQAANPTDSSGYAGWGMTVGPMTDDIRLVQDIPKGMGGVAILSVTSGGKADSVGIRQGDVIQGLDGETIADMSSFLEAVYSDTDETSLLDIYSQGQFRYVSIESAMASLDVGGPCPSEPLSLGGLDRYRSLFLSVPFVGIIGLVFAMVGYSSLSKYPPGDAKMRSIALRIRSGTAIFLRREYTVTALFLILFFVLVSTVLCLGTGIAFLVGALSAMVPGWIGTKAATTANERTCQAAKQEGLSKALTIAFQGGAVMGISVASVGVIALGSYCLIVLLGDSPEALPQVIAGFCLGASLFALFGRVGGGIFTKSADIGADMTGKLELNLSEDDPRNPAAIADNVGDNVGDVAGMGSDLYESYTTAVVATIIIGLKDDSLEHIALPLVLMAMGLVCCLLSIWLSRLLAKGADPQEFLRRLICVSSALFLIGAYVAVIGLTGESSLFLAVLAGVLCGILIGVETEYFASGPPITHIVNMSKTGAATNIIAGLAVGFLGALLPIITIGATIILASYAAGLYGIGLSSVAMLSTMGIIMAIDAYGPIVDNAGGLATMSGARPEVRRITDKLDVAGNTSAAVGKGFTIGAGVITTVALFAAYIVGTKLEHIELFAPKVLVGLLMGVTLPLVFAAWTMGAVTRIANRLVVEVRRQFREVRGLLSGGAEPDTDRCVDIITRDSLGATVVAGTVSVAAPFIVFFILGTEPLAGFLVGAMLTGSVLGMSMSISGVAWDNAKKRIEREPQLEGRIEGEMGVAYKAALVGDMVGDPFKDVAGPSMNILIKLMVTIALVFCSVFCAL